MGQGRVEGEKLAVLSQDLLQTADRHTRLDGGGQVGGVVVDDVGEAGQVDCGVQALQRVAHRDTGAAAPRRHGHVSLAGRLQHVAQLFCGRWARHRPGNRALDGVRGRLFAGLHCPGERVDKALNVAGGRLRHW